MLFLFWFAFCVELISRCHAVVPIIQSYPTGDIDNDPVHMVFNRFNDSHMILQFEVKGDRWFGFGFANSGSDGCTPSGCVGDSVTIPETGCQGTAETGCRMDGVDAMLFGYESQIGPPLVVKEFILVDSATAGSSGGPGRVQTVQDLTVIGLARSTYIQASSGWVHSVQFVRPFDPSGAPWYDRDGYTVTFPFAGDFCWLWAIGDGQVIGRPHSSRGYQCTDFGGTTIPPSATATAPTYAPTRAPTGSPSETPTTMDPTRSPSTPPPSSSPVETLVFEECVSNFALFDGAGSISVEIEETMRKLRVTLTASNGAWFGVGFGGHIMQDTYAVVVHEQADTIQVSQYTLSPGGQNNAEIIDNALYETESADIGNSRVGSFILDWEPASGAAVNSAVYNFTAFLSGELCSLPIIWAKGVTETFGYHGIYKNNELSLPSCRCDATLTNTDNTRTLQPTLAPVISTSLTAATTDIAPPNTSASTDRALFLPCVFFCFVYAGLLALL